MCEYVQCVAGDWFHHQQSMYFVGLETADRVEQGWIRIDVNHWTVEFLQNICKPNINKSFSGELLSTPNKTDLLQKCLGAKEFYPYPEYQ